MGGIGEGKGKKTGEEGLVIGCGVKKTPTWGVMVIRTHLMVCRETQTKSGM